eukprot:1569287-Amphidinium_carterae.1
MAQAVRNFWLMVAPKLRIRPEAWPRIRLPQAETEVAMPPLAGPGEPLPQAPHVEGPHRRVVTFNTFARCLDCHRQTGKVHGKFNFPYLRRQECRPLKKTFAQRREPLAELHPEAVSRRPCAARKSLVASAKQTAKVVARSGKKKSVLFGQCLVSLPFLHWDALLVYFVGGVSGISQT